MKYAVSAIMTIACAVLGATAASAVTFTATSDAPAVLAVGDTFTVDVEFDASDLSTETSLGFAFSVDIDGTAFAVVTGTQLDLVFPVVIPSVGTFGGIPLVSPLLPNNSLDADIVRMGVWGSATPVDPQWGIEIPATVTLEVLPGASGDYDLAPFFAPGDSLEVDGDSNYPATMVGTTVTVPEPGAGLLSFAALASVIGIVRVRRAG